MPLPTDILLAECDVPHGRQTLIAEIDELTLTYTIVARATGGQSRALRRYVPTLREAREWAQSYRASSPGGP